MNRSWTKRKALTCREGSVVTEPKFPNVKVKLLRGHDSNAYWIMSEVKAALKKAGVSQEDIDEYMNEAKSGDWDHLLATTMNTVVVY